MSAARVAVVGGGAWGTALANAAAIAGSRVTLWLRDPEAADRIQRERQNERRLPGITLHAQVAATADPSDLAGAAATLVVVPTQALRDTLRLLAQHLSAGPLVICAKGIERGTGSFVSEVADAVLPRALTAILSGPSFAADVARGLPTAVTLACPDDAAAAALAEALSGPSLRLYRSGDVRGVEIGGAVKNVLAIAAGIVSGRGLGESARAALVARGFAEMARFAAAHGARPETLAGLSGLGDLVLSCASERSRNFAFGERLGCGASVAEASVGRLVEGAWTAPILVDLAQRRGVEMPIAAAVDAVIDGRATLAGMVESLMARPLRAE